MPKNHIHSIFAAFTTLRSGNISMRQRLFNFLIIFAVIMIVAIAVISLTFSRFYIGISRVEEFAQREFTLLHHRLSEQSGETVRQLVSLSESLSRSIETQLANKNIPAASLPSHPEILEEIIGNELNLLLFALERTGNTGVFLVLDATVNPGLIGSEHSKAGLYIRKAEPTVPGAPQIVWCFYRGFPNIAYQNGLQLQGGWRMEFVVQDRTFFHTPLDNARLQQGSTPGVPLSRQYYWSTESIIPGIDEAALVCSIPLIDSKGTVCGVCGFDTSAWNFADKYRSEFGQSRDEFRDIASLLGMVDSNKIDMKTALIAGASIRRDGAIQINTGSGLDGYKHENGSEYIGLHETIRMYPADSPFADHRFALALLIGKREADALARQINLYIIAICAALLALSITVSVVLSRRYVKPITATLDGIRTGNTDATEKTNIIEINQLLEMIEQMRLEEKASGGKHDKPLGENPAFKILSWQELRVADLLLRGNSYTEIAETLKLKPTTVRWYMKILYEKLQINSKRELFELAEKQKDKS